MPVIGCLLLGPWITAFRFPSVIKGSKTIGIGGNEMDGQENSISCATSAKPDVGFMVSAVFLSPFDDG